jgi:hypothetical protein
MGYGMRTSGAGGARLLRLCLLLLALLLVQAGLQASVHALTHADSIAAGDGPEKSDHRAPGCAMCAVAASLGSAPPSTGPIWHTVEFAEYFASPYPQWRASSHSGLKPCARAPPNLQYC